MIPAVNTEVPVEPLEQNETNYYDKTYNLNYKDGVVSGYTENKDALTQSIYRMLNTERYQFPIYSDNYGIRLDDLYGQPLGLVEIELKRKIKDCLLTDDRITGVDSFYFKRQRRGLEVKFIVRSRTDGDITFSKEVKL